MLRETQLAAFNTFPIAIDLIVLATDSRLAPSNYGHRYAAFLFSRSIFCFSR
jgi:hypothetical protein